jgi:hypothetical protein
VLLVLQYSSSTAPSDSVLKQQQQQIHILVGLACHRFGYTIGVVELPDVILSTSAGA